MSDFFRDDPYIPRWVAWPALIGWVAFVLWVISWFVPAAGGGTP